MDVQKVALVIGAGDATGGAIARRFAREGYCACVVRRDAGRLKALVEQIESAGGKARAFGCDARREEAGDRAGRRDRARYRPDRGDGLQHRRQCAVRHPRGNRAQVLQDLGDGLLLRFPVGARGGQADGGARARHHDFHGRDGQPARQRALCRVCRRQARAARAGAEHGARARAEEHPCRALDHRRRHRHRVHPDQLSGPVCTEGTGRHRQSGAHRRRLLAHSRPAAGRVDLRVRSAALDGAVVSVKPALFGDRNGDG